MLGNSFNLIDMIRGHLTGDVLSRVSSVIGESSDKTRTGVAAAVPALLSSLDRTASTSEGARRITSAIDNTDDSMLNNMLGPSGSGYAFETGSGILSSILGAAGVSELTNTVGKTSGLSGKAIPMILSFLVPVVLGVFKRLKRTAGPGNFDIASLLASQRSNIDAAMPEGVKEGIYSGPRIAARDGAAETYTRGTTTRRESHGAQWILPLALLAGALGLIWYWAARPHATHAGFEDVRPGSRAMLSMDDFRTRYGSVLQEAREQGVQISQVRWQNGQFVLMGIAPTQEAANKVWDEIKRVDPGRDQITADFLIAPTSSSGSSAVQESPTQAPDSTSRMYTVQRGDTLGSISKRFYGNTQDYTRILNANRDKVANPNLISVGQELSIPTER